MLALILGGARSGKSRYAEEEAANWQRENQPGERLYIATAEAFDDEMKARIGTHQAQRGNNWRTIEEPCKLVQCLETEMADHRFILVDCLTLWLSNLLLREMNTEQALDALMACLSQPKGMIMIVSNEVGLGIVPDNPLARRFRDLQGIANQRLAALSDRVVLVSAGLPLILKA